MPASGSTHPRFRGIALFPEPGDFTAPPAPCQGPSRGPKSRFPETRITPSRSACRREKRTLRCLSRTQRVSHIDIAMSSAWSVAFPLRIAAARWPRQRLNECTTRQTLCQVVSLPRFLARAQPVVASSRWTHAQTELRFARSRTIRHPGCTCKGSAQARAYRVGSRKLPVIRSRQSSATLSW